MSLKFQAFMILGALVLLIIIFVLLKRGKMTVKYSLLWLGLSLALTVFARMLCTSCGISWASRCRSTWFSC